MLLLVVSSLTMIIESPSTGATIFGDASALHTESLTLLGTISTVAGSEGSSGDFIVDGIAATAARFDNLEDLAADAAGNLFIVSTHKILKVTANTGLVTVVAGKGASGFIGDGGLATSATLSFPRGIALDQFGNMFVADVENRRIRKITVSTGIITTVAGNGGNTIDTAVDNVAATSSSLLSPYDVAVDSFGNIYIVDLSHRVRKVTASTNIITTIAGDVDAFGKNALPQLGVAATLSNFNYPRITVDVSGNVFFTCPFFNSIYKVTASTGFLSLVAGTNNWDYGYNSDGIPATTALLNYPTYLTVDALGNIFFTDQKNRRVRKIEVSTGIITTVAGTTYTYRCPTAQTGQDATTVTLCNPLGVAVDTAGSVYFCDNPVVRKVTYSEVAPSSAVTRAPSVTPVSTTTGSPTATTPTTSPSASSGILSTVAGAQGRSTGPIVYGVPATSVRLGYTMGLAVDAAGNFFVSTGNTILKVTASTGIITVVAGSRDHGFSGDGGLAVSATLTFPYGIALDKFGNIFVADSANHRIRKITVSTGIITTVAGNGLEGGNYYTSSVVDNVAATSTTVGYPRDVAVDALGNIYIAGNSRVRKVTARSGIITTIASISTTIAFNSTVFWSQTPTLGVRATASTFHTPRGVAVDTAGNVFFTDSSFNSIYKISASTGLLSLVAGNNQRIGGYYGDGTPATTSLLNGPTYIIFDALGNIFFSDSENHRVRKIAAGTGIITTVAGRRFDTWPSCYYENYEGDGKAATLPSLCDPQGVAVDTAGSILFCDHHVVRKVTYSEVAPSEAVTRAPSLTPVSTTTGSPTAATALPTPTPTGTTSFTPTGIPIASISQSPVSSITGSPTAATDLPTPTDRKSVV